MKNIAKQPTAPAGARKARQKKILIASIAVAATGVLGYFGWKYYLKKKEEKDNEEIKPGSPVFIPPPVYQPPPVPPRKNTPTRDSPGKGGKKSTGNNMDNYRPEPPASDFPLKPGSKGEKVKRLQEALIEKHGKQVFPKYGADGMFGKEMAAGLAKLKLPATISESVFNVLVQGNEGATGTLAAQLVKAAEQKDFNKAISLLQQIKNQEGYNEVSDQFKKFRIKGGVRQTLVNGMLNTFSKPQEKESIRLQFLRMGLQYDGKKWSLSGLDGLPLVTIRAARVWINATQSIEVPARMVLGNEITRKKDYVLFENRGKYFLIHQSSVKHL